MIGVTMMDAQAFVSAHRGHEHHISQSLEYRRQAEENGSIVHRHHKDEAATDQSEAI